MWARKSNDGGLTWLPDDTFSDVVSPLPAEPEGGGSVSDYDYGSAILTKHVSSWVDGRVTINGISQQDAFFDSEPSPPCPRDQYTIISGADTIVPGTTDSGNHCDNCDTLIALPFNFQLYGQTFNSANVSSNGRLEFVCVNEPSGYGTQCLPAPRLSARLTIPFSLSGRICALMRVWHARLGQTVVAFLPPFRARHPTASSTSSGMLCFLLLLTRHRILRCVYMRTIQTRSSR